MAARALRAQTFASAAAASTSTEPPTLPVRRRPPSTKGSWPGGEDQRPAADGGHVGGDRRGDGGQPDAELGEAGVPALRGLGHAGRLR